MKSDSKNVIYLVSWKYCGKQYVASATGFKEGFRIHKSDINTGKIRCGVQLIEKVFVQNDDDIDKVFWEREKYWQAQLFTFSHVLNNPNEWYALNRRVYRK